MKQFDTKKVAENSRRTRRCLGALLASAAVIMVSLAQGSPATAVGEDRATVCTNVKVPVKAGSNDAQIAGTLCTPPGANHVQVLIHGWTYNRYYWDLPYEKDTYSYVRAANKRGYATFNIDRLGSGASTRLPSAFTNFYQDVSTVHQVVSALKAGSVGPKFDKVITVGHSLGGIVNLTEAGVYGDVDAIIPTGIAHSLNYVNVATKIVAADYPASLDPRFAGKGLDLGYLTSMPGTRAGFYKGTASSTDPEVVKLDEQLKDTGSLVELGTLAAFNILNVSRNINTPVLTVIGDSDPFVCGLTAPTCSSDAAVAAFEKGFYGKGATIETYVAPNTGHDLQLEKSAPTTNARMLEFADKYVGPGTGQLGSAPGSAPPVPTSSPTPPNLVTGAVNGVVVSALVPLITTLQQATNVVPGLGTNVNPVPGVGESLSTIGNLVNALVGTFPARLLAGDGS